MKGHHKKHCKKLKRASKERGHKEKGTKKQNDDGKDIDRVDTVTSPDFFMVYDEDVNIACHETNWVIDSGASIHATSRKDFFTTYTPGDFRVVKMGNNGLAKVIGIGDVCLEMTNGTRLVLRDVKHIPEIRLNLISACKLDDEMYCNTFSDGQWKLTRGAMVVTRGKKYFTLYILQARLSASLVNAMKDESTTKLWHQKLAHTRKKVLAILAKKHLLSGMNSIHLKRCIHCLAGKQHKVSFKSSPLSRKSNVHDLIYSDVCGPMKTRTLGGFRYFATFIYNHSRKLWAYTLNTKTKY